MSRLQGTIEMIRQIISTNGPTTARAVEQHPEVVRACRLSKTKARRHINRLVSLGQVKTDGALQAPKFWVEI